MRASDRTRDVPDADRLIETGRHDEVFTRMELGAHHVVTVARQHTETSPARTMTFNPRASHGVKDGDTNKGILKT